MVISFGLTMTGRVLLLRVEFYSRRTIGIAASDANHAQRCTH